MTNDLAAPLTLILVVLWSPACADVESRAADTTWQLKPVMTIGSEQDARYAFNRLGGLTADEWGRIYAADAGDRQIRVFDSAGNYVRTIGRKGAGPGEFETLVTIGMLSDTLYAVDQAQQRITYFDTSGAFLRTERVNDLLGIGISLHRALDLGRYLVSPISRATSKAPIPRLLISRGQVLDTVGFFSEGRSLTFPMGNGQLHMPDPFAAPQFLAVNSDGSWWIDVSQYPDEGLEPGQARLSVVRNRGGTTWTRLFSQAPVPYTSYEADSVVERLLNPGGRPPLKREDVRAAITIPQYKYPMQGLAVAANGDIWMRLTQHDGANLWMVIDSSGQDVGSVRMPPGTWPSIIQDRRRILLILRDEYDVQTIRAYDLLPVADGARN